MNTVYIAIEDSQLSSLLILSMIIGIGKSPQPPFQGGVSGSRIRMSVICIMPFMNNHTVLLPLEKGAGGIFQHQYNALQLGHLQMGKLFNHEF